MLILVRAVPFTTTSIVLFPLTRVIQSLPILSKVISFVPSIDTNFLLQSITIVPCRLSADIVTDSPVVALVTLIYTVPEGHTAVITGSAGTSPE